MTKRQLILKLNSLIIECTERGDPKDSTSWQYEEGVLITPQLAQEIVEALEDDGPVIGGLLEGGGGL